MKYQPSIVSGDAARKALEAAERLPECDYTSITREMHGHTATFSVRHCTRQGERSGGVVLSVDFRASSSCARWTVTRRLRPGWSADQALTAMGRLAARALHEAHRRRHADQLCVQFDAALSKWLLMEQVDAHATATGLPEMYDEMTVKDIRAWSAWLIWHQRG